MNGTLLVNGVLFAFCAAMLAYDAEDRTLRAVWAFAAALNFAALLIAVATAIAETP